MAILISLLAFLSTFPVDGGDGYNGGDNGGDYGGDYGGKYGGELTFM